MGAEVSVERTPVNGVFGRVQPEWNRRGQLVSDERPSAAKCCEVTGGVRDIVVLGECPGGVEGIGVGDGALFAKVAVVRVEIGTGWCPDPNLGLRSCCGHRVCLLQFSEHARVVRHRLDQVEAGSEAQILPCPRVVHDAVVLTAHAEGI